MAALAYYLGRFINFVLVILLSGLCYSFLVIALGGLNWVEIRQLGKVLLRKSSSI